ILVGNSQYKKKERGGHYCAMLNVLVVKQLKEKFQTISIEYKLEEKVLDVVMICLYYFVILIYEVR
ncbi:hypothetical protein V1477_000619, partial [Vespula maculifrons]